MKYLAGGAIFAAAAAIACPAWAQAPASPYASMSATQLNNQELARLSAQSAAPPAYAQPAYPQAAYPQAAYPQAAYPQAAYPQPAYPQTAYPQPADPYAGSYAYPYPYYGNSYPYYAYQSSY